jgi:hypothetical protein
MALVAAAASGIALISSAQAVPRRATLATFTGTWIGHTRGLTISANGTATESVGSGCCDPIIDLRMKISHPRGNVHVASVKAVVTSVQLHDRSAFGGASVPRVGQAGRIKLRYGVITDTLTGFTFCNASTGAKGRCGA